VIKQIAGQENMFRLLHWHRINHTKSDDQPDRKQKDTLVLRNFLWQVYQVENTGLPI
jgi:hypothetical protein